MYMYTNQPEYQERAGLLMLQQSMHCHTSQKMEKYIRAAAQNQEVCAKNSMPVQPPMMATTKYFLTLATHLGHRYQARVYT